MQNPKPLTNLKRILPSDTLYYLPYGKQWNRPAPERVKVIGTGPKWVRLSNKRRFHVATGLEDDPVGMGGDLFLTEEDAFAYGGNQMEAHALRLDLIDALNGADLSQLRSIANFIANGADTNG